MPVRVNIRVIPETRTTLNSSETGNLRRDWAVSVVTPLGFEPRTNGLKGTKPQVITTDQRSPRLSSRDTLPHIFSRFAILSDQPCSDVTALVRVFVRVQVGILNRRLVRLIGTVISITNNQIGLRGRALQEREDSECRVGTNCEATPMVKKVVTTDRVSLCRQWRTQFLRFSLSGFFASRKGAHL